jgi:hypothetical protein
VFIVLALLVGVVAMHALVMPMGEDHAMPATAAPAAVSARLPAVGPAAVAEAMDVHADMPAHSSPVPSPERGWQELMHLCLAVLAAAVALGLWAITYLIRTRTTSSPAALRMQVVTLWPRPPPRTAVRLAQLCVLRN